MDLTEVKWLLLWLRRSSFLKLTEMFSTWRLTVRRVSYLQNRNECHDTVIFFRNFHYRVGWYPGPQIEVGVEMSTVSNGSYLVSRQVTYAWSNCTYTVIMVVKIIIFWLRIFYQRDEVVIIVKSGLLGNNTPRQDTLRPINRRRDWW